MLERKSDSVVEETSCKQTTLEFAHKKINFHLSLGLFSSNEIDRGSRSLLTSLRKPHYPASNIWDIGCGTGALAVTLATSLYPTARYLVQDRNHLALDYTRFNAQKNSVSAPFQYQHSLLLQAPASDQAFDLIVSNLPAKAGNNILKTFFPWVSTYLTIGGVLAIVIVKTLADLALEAATKAGYDIIDQRTTSQYLILHLQKTAETLSFQFDENNSWYDIYLRERDLFFSPFKRVEYSLDTCYSLPSFDTISYKEAVSFRSLYEIPFTGDVLNVEPQQGHLFAYINASKRRNEGDCFDFASQDSLVLQHMEKQRIKKGVDGEQFCYGSSSDLLSLEKKYANVLFSLEPIAKTPWKFQVAAALNHLVLPAGLAVVTGRSQDVFQLNEQMKGYKIVEDNKLNGYRCIVYKKKGVAV